ncbi:alpha/beta hydrolase [Thalassomonas sp. M1454]|uniref:alpha/beta hydrolase family protein n=1 Tax=Thalassomonas sp. M1454 TaxID=2594477 RepID=UPI0011810A0B|nr:alpha/beta hydrolase [Thalassomonas sp. M1454]TRX56593.1 carboxylesterase family protein [Thalassomonas sp. M1454]
MSLKHISKYLIGTLLIVASSCIAVQANSNMSATITYENIAYGKHPNQIIDFWKADTKEPAPLVIYIHGGGFRGGSHDKVDGKKIEKYLKNGVHHASIEYRLLKHANFPAAHEDVVRALQFIRSKADEWNIDKNRIAAYGGSAGGQLVSYLAWHDDFADPLSEDPISRESSRLTAVAPRGAQSTMDLNWWVENIPGYQRSFSKYADSSKPGVAEMIKELSIINHISADDPPTFMSYGMKPDAKIPKKRKSVRGWAIHHVNFGLAMQEQLKKNGIEAHLTYPGNKTAFKNEVEFLLHHLKTVQAD